MATGQAPYAKYAPMKVRFRSSLNLLAEIKQIIRVPCGARSINFS